MSGKDTLSIMEKINNEFGVDLPILGGSGNSIDDPILIDPKYRDYTEVESTFLKYVNLLLGREWKLKEQTLMEYKGKQIDKIKIEISGEEENYYNYYFDVTQHIGK